MQAFLQQDSMISELFDALSESIVLFKPILHEDGQLVDFEIAYCNNASSIFLNVPKSVVLSQTIRNSALFDDVSRKTLFDQCAAVWETGKSLEENFYNEGLDRHFNTIKSKITDGVISVTRDRTKHYYAEKALKEQAVLFTRILDASADGVMILEAIRNEIGEVVDLRLTHCNKAAFSLAKISPESLGKRMLDILPHLKDSAQFYLHKKVLDTGLPEKIETTFRNEKGEEYGWFIVSLMKMGDNVVSNFIDISAQKSNQQKIEEQADLLDSIFDASTNGIFACEAIRDESGEIEDLQFIKINKAFTEIMGFLPEMVEGASYHSIFPFGKASGLFDSYCRVINTGENFRKEIYYEEEKHRGWYDISAVKRGSNGIVVTFVNATESKRIKQEIEESSKYLQDVIDSSQTGILLLSPVRINAVEIVDFRFKIVNETVARFKGEKPSDLIGKLHSEVFPESGTNGTLQRYKEIAEGKEAETRFENRFNADGVDRCIDVMVKKRNDDLLITVLDITPIRNLQREIADAAEKLNTVVNHASAGMFTLVPVYGANDEIEDFRFSIVNQSVAAYIGEKAEKLKGALSSIYFPAYKTNGLFDIYKDTYVNGTDHQFDFHYEDGYDVYFNIHTTKAADEVLVTFTDHTTLKRLQVQLEASIDELKKSNASLEEFAYAASHDLQEPLRKINYFSERLRKGVGQTLSADDNRMFERMESAASRMSQLITDLLTYSQISRNTPGNEAANLNEILQNVLVDLETTISIKKGNISSNTLPTIKGDSLQLRQLFQNLLSNSLKYSKADVSPMVAIECNEVVKEINGVTKSFYEIAFSDNGIGFEQENAEKIFKVFQRLHGQSEFPGTGIGLAIVHKVVENHHGYINAQGIPGVGCTFTVLFPKE
ncbi:MAG: sensor signal transduction histidine kinase [Segetibacter sp.]|nr:sensor signal transduction histidine kinase [Segetibacter sp.]